VEKILKRASWTLIFGLLAFLAGCRGSPNDSAFLEILSVKDSESGTGFYTNTYAVMSPLPDGRIFIIWTAAEKAPPGYLTWQRVPGRELGRDLKLARFNLAWLQGK